MSKPPKDDVRKHGEKLIFSPKEANYLSMYQFWIIQPSPLSYPELKLLMYFFAK
jgi:hypothetical protein